MTIEDVINKCLEVLKESDSKDRIYEANQVLDALTEREE